MDFSKELLEFSQKRRTYRSFLPDEIEMQTIQNCILTAGTAPSGANKQPWHFCVVQDPAIKAEIRKQSEETEKVFYAEKISKEWSQDLEQFSLSWQKPFLEEAPLLIVVFKEFYKLLPDGNKDKNYYVPESVGISIGFLIHALHNAGLASVTYTPAPMDFLRKILGRPVGETPVMVLAVGKANPSYPLPDITKKTFAEIADIF